MNSSIFLSCTKDATEMSEMPNGSLNNNGQLLLGVSKQDCSYSVKIAVGIARGDCYE